MAWLFCPLLRVESWMCAEDGEPSLIFSSSVGWRREDGGGMKDGSGTGTEPWALLDGLTALLGLAVVEVLQNSII